MKTILTLLALFVLTSCDHRTETQAATRPHALEQWVGTEVTVYFRRDSLGAAGTPIAPTTTWLNNTKVSLDGKISAVYPDGLFLDSHYKSNSGDSDLRHSNFWIPADSILTIEKKL